MFRLMELETVHWDYWRNFKLPLDAPIITISGPNGSGKTTLLDLAFDYAEMAPRILNGALSDLLKQRGILRDVTLEELHNEDSSRNSFLRDEAQGAAQ